MTRTARARAVFAFTGLAAGLLVVASASPASAAACTLEQITDHASSSLTSAVINGDGTRVLVSGSASLDGDPNPGNNPELWLYDTSTSDFTRITDTPSGSNFQASLNEAGDRIAFTSSADIGGNNPDGNQEIYRWSSPATITPITTTAVTVGQGNASQDASGNLIAYSSTIDGNAEIFLHDVVAGGPDDQITVTAPTVTNGGANLNDAGTKLTYLGNGDGNYEVYLHSLAGAGSTTKLTASALGNSTLPRINAAGTRVTFQSNTNIGGGNADGSNEIFQRVLSTGVTTRLTGGPNPAVNLVPRTDAAGTRVVFNDNRDLTGDNAAGNQEVFVRDVGGTGHLTQLTSSTLDAPTSSDASNDGTRIALVSSADPFGDNADGNSELFIATCGAPVRSFNDVAYGNAFFDQIEWMTETGIASGFPGGLFKPEDAVKRQQMANFLYNLAGQPPFKVPAEPTFVDVPESNPFFLQIEWMNATGVASGFPGGLFKPEDAVKRQQMANFLYNLAGQPAFTPPGSPTFADYPPGSAFYLQVEWMSAMGIAQGFPDGFHPLEPVKRQQMANFVFNFATCCEINS